MAKKLYIKKEYIKLIKNKENKLSVIKDTMLNGYFMVSDRCPKTVWEIKKYAKDDKGKIPMKNDHQIDNLRYIYNAAGYDKAPKKKIDKDKVSSRRFYTPAKELQENAYNELLMGGISELDYENIVSGSQSVS